MAAEEALAQLDAAVASRPGFVTVARTLRDNAGKHADLVLTLAQQITVALKESPAAAAGKALAAPAEAVDVSKALCTLPNLQFLTPRGRFDMAILADSFVLVSKGTTLRVPYSSVERVLVLEKPGDSKKAVYMMIPLAKAAPLEQGKTKHATLLLQVKGDDPMEAILPKSGEQAKAAAPAVIARVLGEMTGKATEEPSVNHFKSSRGLAAVVGTFKVNPGLLFPLKSGFAFVEKPPLYLPYDSWDGLELGRSGGQGSTFDLKVGAAGGPGTEITMIPRDEMDALRSYVAGRTEVILKKEAAAKSAAAAAEKEKRAADGGGAAGAAAAAADGQGEKKEDESDSDDEEDEDFRGSSDEDDDGSASSSSSSDGSRGSDGSDDGSGSEEEAEAAASKPKAAKADKPKSAAKAAKKASKENTKPKAAAASGPVGVAQQQKKKKAAAAAAAPAEKKKAAGSGGDGDDSSSESDGGGAARWGMVRTADQAAVGVEEEGEEGGIAVAKKQRTDEPGKESAAASD